MSAVAVVMIGVKARRNAGFSLIELSIVLVIMGVLIGAVIRPVVAEYEDKILEETQRALDDARDALMGYAAANGYLPCPADAASNGLEAKGTDHNTGACPGGWYGFLPAATLGLTSADASGYAVDGTRRPANRVRYAVSNETLAGVANTFTRRSGMRQAGVKSLDQNLFFICASGTGVNPGIDCGTAGTLTSRAVAVVWSVGGNASTGGASVHEAQNPNPNGGTADRIFVSRPRSVIPGAEFDDALIWLPAHVLVNRLVAAGQLP